MDCVLSVKDISKKYEKLNIKNINFDVSKGDIVAILGPNGSGKTTLLKILSTRIKPDSGKTEFFGDKNTDLCPVRKRIGILFEIPSLYGCLTVYENLEFFAKLYGAGHGGCKETIYKWLERLNILDRKDSAVDSLSYGLKRRADIARVFISNPEIIMLDEPFKGLDSASASRLAGIIRVSAKNNAAVIYTTNKPGETEHLASKACVLNKNKFRYTSAKNIKAILHEKN